MSNPETKPDLSIRICGNCDSWEQLKSIPSMGFCKCSRSAANGVQMFKGSYCDCFRLRKDELKK